MRKVGRMSGWETDGKQWTGRIVDGKVEDWKFGPGRESVGIQRLAGGVDGNQGTGRMADGKVEGWGQGPGRVNAESQRLVSVTDLSW